MYPFKCRCTGVVGGEDAGAQRLLPVQVPTYCCWVKWPKATLSYSRCRYELTESYFQTVGHPLAPVYQTQSPT